MEESDKIWAIIITAIGGAGALASAFINLSIAGPIIGLVAGSIITYFIQNRTQHRSWKRDFIINNIETIYGPLYNSSLKIYTSLLNIDQVRSYSTLPKDMWDSIQNSYIYHMIDDEELRKELENFYLMIQTFNELCSYARQRSYEILEKRGSEFYGVNVKNIFYTHITNEGGSSSPIIHNCILFKIHPHDADYYKTDKIRLSIEYQKNGTLPRLDFDSPDKIKEFDKLWKLMVDDVNQDSNLQYLESLKLKIHSENVKIQQKLVKRINQRHTL